MPSSLDGGALQPVFALCPGNRLFQPVEALPPYAFSDVVDEVRSVFFPEIERRVEVRIAAEGSPAFICYHFYGRDDHMIAFHPILNDARSLGEVICVLYLHEPPLHHPPRPPRLGSVCACHGTPSHPRVTT